MNGPPALPPSPLAPESPDTRTDARLPWSTLLYALACGVVAGPLLDVSMRLVVHSQQRPTASDLGQDVAYGVVVVGATCLAFVLADRITAMVVRWQRWALALGVVGLVSPLAFLAPLTPASPAPRLMVAVALFVAAADALAAAVAGGLLGLAAGARSGLLLRLPLVAAAAALVLCIPQAVLSAPALMQVRYAQTVLEGLCMGYLMEAPVLVAAAFAVALGLQAARRKAGAARCAPTTAWRGRS